MFTLASNLLFAEMVVNKEGKRVILNADNTWIYFKDLEPSNPELVDGDIKGIYVGEVKDGKAHGYGISKGKDSYEGYFKDGIQHGYGKYTWGKGKWQGDIYEGEWKEGRRTGQGKYIDHTGLVGEGQFKNGTLNGKGKLSYLEKNNTIIIEGNFFYGSAKGESKYTRIMEDSTIILEGNITYKKTGLGVPALNGYGKSTIIKAMKTTITEGNFNNSVPIIGETKITTIKTVTNDTDILMES